MSFFHRKTLLSALLLAALVVAGGCAQKVQLHPFVPKAEVAPPLIVCCDATGHKEGAKPYILGGTCTCTPTPQLMSAYHRDGHCKDMTLEDLMARYNELGVATDLDHSGCNNLCNFGPHLTKGGKCMSTPTIGTGNYEEIVSGGLLSPAPREQVMEEIRKRSTNI